MASQSQVSVCNIALLGLGVQQQISSLNEGSAQSNACATLFTFVFEQYARTAQWGCLKKQSSLTLIQAAQGTPENPDGTSLPIPQQPWLYAYLYPSDCLQMRQILCPVLPTSSAGTPQTTVTNAVTPFWSQQGLIPYETGYTTDSQSNPLEIVLTNQEQAVANYTVNQPSPQSWDSMFTSGFCAALGAYLVPALALDKALMQLSISVADRMASAARAADGNETPARQDRPPDWLRARSGASGYYNYAGLNGYRAYGTMQWPV